MAIAKSERVLSVSRIARASGLSRQAVRVLIDHYSIPIYCAPTLTAVKPEGLDRLIEVLERNPRVKPGLRDRL